MTAPMSASVTGVGVVAPRPGDDPDTWFDVRARLGARGYKYLPPASQYLLAAARTALDGTGLTGLPEERRGAVLATNGGLTPTLDAMDRTVLADGADGLSPVRAPYFAINVLGSRLTADHGLKAFALTVTSPGIAGLEAVQAGLRAMAAGRCDAFLIAVTEDTPDEQGAVALVIEPTPAAGRSVCRVRTLFAPPRGVRTAVGRDRVSAAVRAAVKELDGGAGLPVDLVADGSPVADVVGAALIGVSGDVVRTAAGGGCLAPMLRLAEALADPAGDRLIVAASGAGGIALARVGGSASC